MLRRQGCRWVHSPPEHLREIPVAPAPTLMIGELTPIPDSHSILLAAMFHSLQPEYSRSFDQILIRLDKDARSKLYRRFFFFVLADSQWAWIDFWIVVPWPADC